MTKEADIMRQIQVGMSAIGARVFRNNSGNLKNDRGQYVKFGVANPGGSDLIGWRTIEIMPWHIGTKVAVFTAIEVKRPGQKPTKEQTNFIEAVRAAGGIAAVCTSEAEALKAIQG